MESFFKKVFSTFTPVVRASDEDDELVDPQQSLRVSDDEDEEVVDPQAQLREKCGDSECASLQEKYQACNDRVNSKKNTTEICAEELYDFLHCVDHCVTKDLFKLLK